MRLRSQMRYTRYLRVGFPGRGWGCGRLCAGWQAGCRWHKSVSRGQARRGKRSARPSSIQAVPNSRPPCRQAEVFLPSTDAGAGAVRSTWGSWAVFWTRLVMDSWGPGRMTPPTSSFWLLTPMKVRAVSEKITAMAPALRPWRPPRRTAVRRPAETAGPAGA